MDKEFGKKAIEEAQQHASKYENIAFALQQVETLSETAVQQMINARLGPEAGFLAGGLYRLNNSFLKLASQIALDENKQLYEKEVLQKAFSQLMASDTWEQDFQETTQAYLTQKLGRALPKEAGKVLSSVAIYVGSDFMSQVLGSLMEGKNPIQNIDFRSIGLSALNGLVGGFLGVKLDKTQLGEYPKMLIEASYDGVSAIVQELILAHQDGKELSITDIIAIGVQEAGGELTSQRGNHIHESRNNEKFEAPKNSEDQRLNSQTREVAKTPRSFQHENPDLLNNPKDLTVGVGAEEVKKQKENNTSTSLPETRRKENNTKNQIPENTNNEPNSGWLGRNSDFKVPVLFANNNEPQNNSVRGNSSFKSSQSNLGKELDSTKSFLPYLRKIPFEEQKQRLMKQIQSIVSHEEAFLVTKQGVITAHRKYVDAIIELIQEEVGKGTIEQIKFIPSKVSTLQEDTKTGSTGIKNYLEHLRNEAWKYVEGKDSADGFPPFGKIEITFLDGTFQTLVISHNQIAVQPSPGEFHELNLKFDGNGQLVEETERLSPISELSFIHGHDQLMTSAFVFNKAKEVLEFQELLKLDVSNQEVREKFLTAYKEAKIKRIPLPLEVEDFYKSLEVIDVIQSPDEGTFASAEVEGDDLWGKLDEPVNKETQTEQVSTDKFYGNGFSVERTPIESIRILGNKGNVLESHSQQIVQTDFENDTTRRPGYKIHFTPTLADGTFADASKKAPDNEKTKIKLDAILGLLEFIEDAQEGNYPANGILRLKKIETTSHFFNLLINKMGFRAATTDGQFFDVAIAEISHLIENKKQLEDLAIDYSKRLAEQIPSTDKIIQNSLSIDNSNIPANESKNKASEEDAGYFRFGEFNPHILPSLKASLKVPLFGTTNPANEYFPSVPPTFKQWLGLTKSTDNTPKIITTNTEDTPIENSISETLDTNTKSNLIQLTQESILDNEVVNNNNADILTAEVEEEPQSINQLPKSPAVDPEVKLRMDERNTKFQENISNLPETTQQFINNSSPIIKALLPYIQPEFLEYLPRLKPNVLEEISNRNSEVLEPISSPNGLKNRIEFLESSLSKFAKSEKKLNYYLEQLDKYSSKYPKINELIKSLPENIRPEFKYLLAKALEELKTPQIIPADSELRKTKQWDTTLVEQTVNLSPEWIEKLVTSELKGTEKIFSLINQLDNLKYVAEPRKQEKLEQLRTIRENILPMVEEVYELLSLQNRISEVIDNRLSMKDVLRYGDEVRNQSRYDSGELTYKLEQLVNYKLLGNSDSRVKPVLDSTGTIIDIVDETTRQSYFNLASINYYNGEVYADGKKVSTFVTDEEILDAYIDARKAISESSHFANKAELVSELDRLHKEYSETGERNDLVRFMKSYVQVPSNIQDSGLQPSLFGRSIKDTIQHFTNWLGEFKPGYTRDRTPLKDYTDITTLANLTNKEVYAWRLHLMKLKNEFNSFYKDNNQLIVDLEKLNEQENELEEKGFSYGSKEREPIRKEIERKSKQLKTRVEGVLLPSLHRLNKSFNKELSSLANEEEKVLQPNRDEATQKAKLHEQIKAEADLIEGTSIKQKLKFFFQYPQVISQNFDLFGLPSSTIKRQIKNIYDLLHVDLNKSAVENPYPSRIFNRMHKLNQLLHSSNSRFDNNHKRFFLELVDTINRDTRWMLVTRSGTVKFDGTLSNSQLIDKILLDATKSYLQKNPKAAESIVLLSEGNTIMSSAKGDIKIPGEDVDFLYSLLKLHKLPNNPNNSFNNYAFYFNLSTPRTEADLKDLEVRLEFFEEILNHSISYAESGKFNPEVASNYHLPTDDLISKIDEPVVVNTKPKENISEINKNTNKKLRNIYINAVGLIHPDVRPNDPVASDLFKRLSIAYNEGNEVELIKIADEIEKHVDNK
jgi:hypothetical protein